MTKRPVSSSSRQQGLPSRQQILDLIAGSTEPVGKKEIARAFALKGNEKIELKALLKDMAEEGLIDGKRTAYHRMGGVPRVTVLRVVEIDGAVAYAIPDNWEPDSGEVPPRLRVIEKGRRGAAMSPGDRFLARTEEIAAGMVAHPMKLLARGSELLLGVIELDDAGRPWLAPVDKRIRHATRIGELGEARPDDLVRAELSGRGARSSAKVVEILGDLLAPKAFSLIAIHKYGIPNHFSEALLAEAQTAAGLPLDADRREDLRHLPIVAIDPSDARDHDDAIWAEADGEGGFNAIVAIADVSYYVRPGSLLDKEGRKRGNSVYFPDRVVPMLPEVLSADVCSLRQDVDRASLACHLQIDSKGKLKGWRFTRAIVRIHEVIAYQEAQRRIDRAEAEPHIAQLWECWRLLDKARSARDPLELDLPERRVELDDAGRISSIAMRERLDAHRVVEDFMITANVAAAKALESKASPVVYRIHEPPGREKLVALKDYLATFDKKLALGQVITPGLFNRMLKDIADESEKALIMEAVLRSQTQAYYGPKNAGHFGLALGSYAHFTSPIRRYADLLVHRALVDSFGLEMPAPKDKAIPRSTGLSDDDKGKLERVTDAISGTERRAMEAERETIDRYVAAWLSGRVGEAFETRVTGVQKFGLFATIIGLGGDGLVPISVLGDERFAHDERARQLVGEETGTRYAIGDILRLRLAEANPLTGALKFEPLTASGAGSRVEPRGHRSEPRRDQPGKRMVGKRGRPDNIRHQGRKKR